MTTPTIPPYLTLAEVAELLRLHVRTVRELVRRGELEGRIVGNRWRFRREAIDAFFDSRPKEWTFARVEFPSK